MGSRVRFVLAGAAVALAAPVAAAQEAPADLPLQYAYPVICPLCDDPLAVTVRQDAEGRSAAVIHAAADPAPEGGKYVASPRTDGRMGIVQDLGRPIIEVPEVPALEPGRRYDSEGDPWDPAADAGSPSWAVDGLSIAFEDGDDDRTVAGLAADHRVLTVGYERTDYDGEGAVVETTAVDHRRDLWFAEALEFTPLQMLHGGFRDVAATPSFVDRIDEHVLGQVIGEFAPLGALVRVETTIDGEAFAVEMTDRQAIDAAAVDAADEAPVVSEERFAAVAGPLFLSQMVAADQGLAEAGEATLTLGDREIEARAAFKVTDAGDLAVAVKDPAGDTMLLLVRPLNGMPAVGAYGVTRSKSGSELRAMDEDALAAHAQRFQLYGVAAGDGLPAAVTGFEDGTVTIDAVAEDRLSGTVEGTVTRVPTERLGAAQAVPITIDFAADRGLDRLRFASPASRVAAR